MMRSSWLRLERSSRCCSDSVGASLVVTVTARAARSEEHTSELQSRLHLVCRLLLEKKKNQFIILTIGSSKKVANHTHSVALLAPNYHFVRIHTTSRTTQATSSGISYRLFAMTEIVD